jgi:hypothetical protein
VTAPARYPVRTRILHWLTAVLVFSTLFIGFVMVTSLGSYASLRGVHMTLGALVLAIVVVRAANRFAHRVPKLPDTVLVRTQTCGGLRADAVRTDAGSAARRMGDGVGVGRADSRLWVTTSPAHCTAQCRPVFHPPPEPFTVGLRLGGRHCGACQRGAAAHIDAPGRHAVTNGVRATRARVCIRHAAELCDWAHARAR